jgi:hypothetical protein
MYLLFKLLFPEALLTYKPHFSIDANPKLPPSVQVTHFQFVHYLCFFFYVHVYLCHVSVSKTHVVLALIYV